MDPILLKRRKLAAMVMAGRAFMIKTPVCGSYIRHLTAWLTTGSHGAIVFGRPRLGKTSATRWVLRNMFEFVGYVPCVEVPIREQTRVSEREFFQHVLRCARHKHYDEGTAGDKRDRLVELLTGRALRSPVNSVVIFIDEAQLLTRLHFKWLLNIDNELDARGCRLFCLLVGQAELLWKKQKLIDDGLEQIVGRFMVREFEFPGIQSYEALTECLKQFDLVIYPVGSRLRFAENFLPQAVASGFLLEQISPGLWSGFENEWQSEGLDSAPVIPMHYLTATVMGILISLVKHDTEQLQVKEEKIKRCIRESGYVESLWALKAEKNGVEDFRSRKLR